MKLSNICCVSTWMGDRLSITSCSGSMHEPCVGLQYFSSKTCLSKTDPLSSIYFSVFVLYSLVTYEVASRVETGRQGCEGGVQQMELEDAQEKIR